MRAVLVLFGFLSCALAPVSAQAFKAGLLEEGPATGDVRLLEDVLEPAVPTPQLLLGGSGGDASPGQLAFSGVALAVIGTGLTVFGTVLIVDDADSGGLLDGMGTVMGVSFVVLGALALFGSYRTLRTPPGGGGDAPLAVLPARRAVADRTAKSDVGAAPLSMGLAF